MKKFQKYFNITFFVLTLFIFFLLEYLWDLGLDIFQELVPDSGLGYYFSPVPILFMIIVFAVNYVVSSKKEFLKTFLYSFALSVVWSIVTFLTILQTHLLMGGSL